MKASSIITVHWAINQETWDIIFQVCSDRLYPFGDKQCKKIDFRLLIYKIRGGPYSWHSFMLPFIHASNYTSTKHSLRFYYAAGTVLGPEDREMSEIPDMTFLHVLKLTIQVQERRLNYQSGSFKIVIIFKNKIKLGKMIENDWLQHYGN